MFSPTINDDHARRIPVGFLPIRIAGLATAGIGTNALLGWLMGIPRMASLGVDLMPMAPSSAVLFILFGFAVSLCAEESLARSTRILCAAIVALGTMTALVLFVAASQGVLWKAELLGLSLKVHLEGMPIGHISPVGAVCFMLAGVTFLVSLIPTGRIIAYARVSLSLASLLLMFCVVLLIAYFLESPLFYEGAIIPPAMTTMLAFSALGAGLWAHAYRQLLPKGEPAESTLTKRAGSALAVVFCLLVIGVVSLGSLYYRNQERHFRFDAEQHLSSIANLKADQLVQWRKERLDDAAVFFKNPVFTALVRRYFGKTDDAEAQGLLRLWLSQVQPQYCPISLHDVQGVQRMSIPDAPDTDSSNFARCAAEVLRTRQIVFEDFYRNAHDQKVYLAIFVPILDEQDGDRVLGILSMRIDPQTYLFPFIQRWPTPTQTAETLLVRREGNSALFLNELRFKKNTALNVRSSLKQSNQPAVKAVTGYEGIVEGPDYRDMPVLAAVRAIPGSPWFIVARKDLAEINAPLRERLWMTLLLSTVLLLGSGAAAGLIWRQASVGVYREKLAASEALRHEQHLMLTLMENLPNYIYFKDTASRFVRINPAMASLFGLSDPAQIAGKSDADFFTEEHVQKTVADEQEIIRTGRPLLDMEEKETWADGSQRWVLTSKLPLRDGAGRIIGICGIASDITERKRAEEDLRKSEERYRSLFENMLEGYAHCRVLCKHGKPNDFVYLDVNKAFETLTGLKGVVGRPISEVIPGIYESNRELLEMYGRVAETGNPERYETYVEPLGIWFSIAAYCPRRGEFVAVFDNITDRRRTEETLRASEVRYRRLFESSKDGILILDAQTGMIVDVNPYLVGLLGYSHEEFAGKKVWDLGFFKDLFANKINFSELQEKEYIRYEDMPLETAGGQRIDVEFISNVYLVNRQKVIQCDIRDITARKRVEKALLNADLELKEKNAELERFLYSSSHDLKSPVVTVKTFLGYLRKDMAAADSAQIEKDLFYINSAAEKMGRLLDELLEMSRIGRVVTPPVKVTFQTLVNEALDVVAGSIAKRGVAVSVSGNDIMLYGDRPRLAEVWQNLVDNSCKFMGAQKDPRIEIGMEARGEETVFHVRDNGGGIDPRHQSKVFGLFEKLDPKAEGTGIGLALVKRIVEIYGGRIWVESAGLGQGANFLFTLPGAIYNTQEEEKS